MAVSLIHADMREALVEMEPDSVDSVVCDPPYHLASIVKRFGPGQAAAQFGTNGAFQRASRGFMGCEWDGGDIAFQPETWALVLRVLKPGGHLLAFNHSRTFHRMWCAVEDAGFEIRDTLFWAYGSGFPKSHDVSKGVDKALGVERTEVVGSKLGRPGMSKDGSNQRNVDNAFGGEFRGILSSDITAPATPEAAKWAGWGTALKPALEPIVLARKPLSESSIARQVMATGTGALNIDGCRVPHVTVEGGSLAQNTHLRGAVRRGKNTSKTSWSLPEGEIPVNNSGRWPANLIHDGSHEVRSLFPRTASGSLSPSSNVKATTGWSGGSSADRVKSTFTANEGSAARFFYCPKADKKDRRGSKHPTVKPHDLMRWLVRLVTPPGGTVLDCFAGSGSTGWAARSEGVSAILIEREAEYAEHIRRVLDGRESAPESVEDDEEPAQRGLFA